MHNLLFSTPTCTLWLNYVTVTYLLVSSLVTNHDLLCFAHNQGQKSEQKHRTTIFDELHNHFPLSTTMLRLPGLSKISSMTLAILHTNGGFGKEKLWLA